MLPGEASIWTVTGSSVDERAGCNALVFGESEEVCIWVLELLMEIALDPLIISSSLLMKVEEKRLSVSHTSCTRRSPLVPFQRNPHRTIPCVAEMPEPLQRAGLLRIGTGPGLPTAQCWGHQLVRVIFFKTLLRLLSFFKKAHPWLSFWQDEDVVSVGLLSQGHTEEV